MNNSDDMNTGVLRFNMTFTLIGLAIAGLIGWAISFIPSDDHIRLTAALAAGLSTALYVLTILNVGGSRSAVVIRSLSSTTLIISLIAVTLMAIWCTTTAYYIIVLGLIALIFLGITVAVAKSGQ